MANRALRPSKFTEDQILLALREVKTGTPAVEVCRKLGITQTNSYRWRNKYDGVAVSELLEVRELRENPFIGELFRDERPGDAERRSAFSGHSAF